MADGKTYIVINQTLRPVTLESGIHLGAGGREGSRKEGVSLTDNDFRRLVSRGTITAIEEAAPVSSNAGSDGGKKGKAPAPVVDSGAEKSGAGSPS